MNGKAFSADDCDEIQLGQREIFSISPIVTKNSNQEIIFFIRVAADVLHARYISCYGGFIILIRAL